MKIIDIGDGQQWSAFSVKQSQRSTHLWILQMTRTSFNWTSGLWIWVIATPSRPKCGKMSFDQKKGAIEMYFRPPVGVGLANTWLSLWTSSWILLETSVPVEFLIRKFQWAQNEKITRVLETFKDAELTLVKTVVIKLPYPIWDCLDVSLSLIPPFVSENENFWKQNVKLSHLSCSWAKK